MRKIYASKTALKHFENANQKISDKLKFILTYIADEKHPLCEPYVKHISIGKYSLFYELRIKVAKEIVRVIFHLVDNDIVLLYTFCKNDKRDIYQKYGPYEIRCKCLFVPNCSEYMILAIEKYGLIKGIRKGINRFHRCHAPNGGTDFP